MKLSKNLLLKNLVYRNKKLLSYTSRNFKLLKNVLQRIQVIEKCATKNSSYRKICYKKFKLLKNVLQINSSHRKICYWKLKLLEEKSWHHSWHSSYRNTCYWKLQESWYQATSIELLEISINRKISCKKIQVIEKFSIENHSYRKTVFIQRTPYRFFAF